MADRAGSPTTQAAAPVWRTLTLPPDLAEAATARSFVGEVAEEAGFSSDRVFEIKVSCSEAVANAIEHAPVKGRIEVRAGVLTDRLEVQVEGPGEFQTPDRLKERGNRGMGLPLMARLSDHLALYSTTHGGTLVSLTFYRPGVPLPAPEAPLPPSVLELLEASELTRSITENIPVMLVMFDPRLGRFTLNRHAREVLGWTNEEANEGDFMAKVYPDPAYRAEVEGFMQSLQPGWREWWVTAKGGSRVPTSWANVRLTDDTFIGIGIDLSERFAAEAERVALQDEVDRQHTLLAAVVAEAPVAFALWRASDLRLELFNPAYQALAPGKDMEGRTLMEIWPEIPEILAEFRRVAETGEPFEARDRPFAIRRTADGPEEVRRFTYSLARIRLPDRGEWGLLNMAIETSERYAAEAALASSRTELQDSMDLISAIVEGSPDLIAAVDTDFRYVAMNQAYRDEFRTVYGRDVEVGDNMLELLQELPHDVRQAREMYSQALAGEQVVMSSVYGDPARARRHYEFRVSPIRRADGMVIGAAQTGRDVTKEVETRRDEDERARLAAASNRMNDVTTSTMPYQQVLQEVLDEMCRTLEVDSGTISMREDAGWVVHHAFGFEEDLRGARFSDDEVPFAALVAEIGSAVVVDDTETDTRVEPETTRRYGVRSVLVAPLTVKGEVIGALYAMHRFAPRPFTSAEVDFARRTANSLSLAIESAESFAALSEELARVGLLSDVASALAHSLGSREVGSSVLDALVAHLRPHLAGFYSLRRDGRTLELVAAHGYADHDRVWTAEIPCDDSSNLGYLLLHRLPYLTHETAPNPPGSRRRTAEADAGNDRFVMIPLRVASQLLGGMVLTFPGRRPFGADEMTLYQTIGSLVSVGLRNARQYEEQRSIAESLQGALLNIPERVGPLRLGHLYRSATEAALVGGDFYDVFELADGRIGLVVGDVSGHGISAARTATLVRDMMHAFTHQTLAPDLVLEGANDLLIEKQLRGFVTAFLGIVDPYTGELEYSSAGHPPVLLRRAEGHVEPLLAGSAPLGVYPHSSWKRYSARLGPGDLLALYTDGITEAGRGGELYGESRLAGLIAGSEPDAETLPARVLDEVLAYAEGRLADDAAFLAVSLSTQDEQGGNGGMRRFRQERLLE